MRLDQIRAREVEHAADEFIASIDQEQICALASSYHGGQPCQIFSEMKKGSFNLCYPVIFPSNSGSTDGEKWIVRIPWIPRIAFPEEKMRGEIVTMKYIAERTKIPTPRLFGYAMGSDNLIGAPFMIVEYIEGRQLSEYDLRGSAEGKVYRQLAEIFLEFYEQQFDRIGALTLDSDDSSWVFNNNRPLSSNMSEQEVGGLDASSIIPLHHTFTSTIDYFYALTRLTFNDYVRSRDSVPDEETARDDLYDLYKFREILMDWNIPEYNYEPFFLLHGVLRPGNIIVDEDCNIKAIIDWEWSRTVPAQLFVPPGWISGTDISAACGGAQKFLLILALGTFNDATKSQILDTGRYPQGDPWSHPLIKLWRKTLGGLSVENFCIAHALLRLDKCIDIYWKILDGHYHDSNHKKRVEPFFEADARKPDANLVRTKMDQLDKKELKDFGIELRLREGPVGTKPEKEQKPVESQKSWRKEEQVFFRPLYDALLGPSIAYHSHYLFWATISTIFVVTPLVVGIKRFWK